MKERKRKTISVLIIILLILIHILLFTPTVLTGSEVDVSFLPVSNEPPDAPINQYPANGSKNIPIPVKLEVLVYDNTSDTVDVYFYDASDDSLIGIDTDVPALFGGIATVTWTGLNYQTTYSWYAVANDSEFENKSDTWIFTTESSPPPEEPPYAPPEEPDTESPVADAGGPYLGEINSLIEFDGSDSYDPDGYIVAYRWDFTNDGLYDTDWMEEPYANHTYSAPGNYTLKLQVKDDEGATDTNTTYVNITENKWPIADAGGPYSGSVNRSIEFNGSGSYDPDGFIVGYRWDFDNNGTYDTDWMEEPYANHTYSVPGNYTLKLQVKDNEGATGENTTIVRVFLGMPPVADANGPYYGLVGEEIEFNGSASYDPDGTITGYLWNFGDNQTSDLINPVHSYLSPGNYTVTLKVTDDLGNVDVYTTTATIQDKLQLPLQLITIIVVSVIIALLVVFKPTRIHLLKVFVPVRKALSKLFAPIAKPLSKLFTPIKKALSKIFKPVVKTLSRRFKPVKRSLSKKAFKPIRKALSRRFKHARKHLSKVLKKVRRPLSKTLKQVKRH